MVGPTPHSAVAGYFNPYRNFGDEETLKKAIDCLEFIKLHLIDYENGEWFWSLRSDGTINRDDDKADFRKCQYHNGRMCMEIML
ncbi:Cellobiose 2-epimerase [termite gut metagenome]|uniref:Cellobiose 2-epimerase n=1 Tax=termite gut metagenome TaxID=433724 RepID=A0A5J4P7Z5_9ZZZZ